MTYLRTLLAALVLALAVTPPAAADATGRHYGLHTLSYRVAETLVWDICKSHGGIGAECQVQAASPANLTVRAPLAVHAQISEMLAKRDPTVPTSLLFEIVLVELVDNGDNRLDASPAPHQLRALEAIREVFPGKRAMILDTGLIRTKGGGQTQLANAKGDLHVAYLQLRSTVGGEDGLVFTVDLDLRYGASEDARTILGSRLTIAEGETVVAGSSRTDSETSMVVLLTSKSRG